MTARLISYKTENQIFNDFINLAQASLENFGLTEWKFRQLNQVFKVNILEPTVFISIINKTQRGQQYRKRSYSGGIITKTNYTKPEVQIRFSALKNEQASDTLQTYNATDALELIKEYMQSDDGIQYLAELGYAQYRANPISEQNFANDSDNFQFLPYFDCTFVYTNTWSTTVGEITDLKEKAIYKI